MPALIPALLNPRGGSAAAARDALRADGRFEVREAAGEGLREELRRVVSAGATRVVVAGGDGTVAVAANELAGTGIELGIVPAGTLNHFARRAGIPDDPAAACALAVTGRAHPFDVGRVNGRVFINTSSAGAYVGFVRLRDRLEPALGYHLATVVASFRIFFGLRTIGVTLEAGGRRLERRTPLVFVGVGERLVGPRWAHGGDGAVAGLHVLVVRDRGRARLLALAFSAAARAMRIRHGARPEYELPRMPDVDALLVERCTVTLRHRGRISLDGELVAMEPPLEYEVLRGVLMVVDR